MNDIIPIKGFLETSFLDWPGNLASVIFLPSCNFRCPYCQNFILVSKPQLVTTIPLSAILERLEELKEWVDGVCITGGEPTVHEALPDLIRVFKKKSFLVKLDTNGSNPRMINDLITEKLIDAVAMDIKAPLDEVSYSKLIGVPVDLKKIKESITIIRESDVEAFFRTTIIPELLTEEDIYRLAGELCPIKKLVLQQFSPENTLDPTLKKTRPWDQEKLEHMQQEVDRIMGQKG